MKKIIKVFFLFFCAINLISLDFKVATYNVENFFDLKYDGTEYKQYKPNSKYWNKKAFNTKITNISKIIKELNADILSMQEIENKNTLKELLKHLPQYKYFYFLKKNSSSIGVAIISKFEIISNTKIVVNMHNPYSRPILKSTIKIKNKKLIIYTNHWKSKRSAENVRILYAKALIDDINTLNKKEDYIILGDLNSNYNESVTFKYDKKLNTTYGITAINQVLNTSLNGNLIQKSNLSTNSNIHYNLWLELKHNQRYSSIYRTQNITPDNIILSKNLFDNKNISYVNNSFKVFNKKYLIKKHKLNRWNYKKQKGYSDHLPIFAMFSTKQQTYPIFKTKKISEYKIDNLYDIQTLNKSIILKNIVVIYKYKNIAIIKSKKSRAILIYKVRNDLKLNHIYDIRVNKIDTYQGLKEITQYELIKQKSKINSAKDYYKDALKINLLDDKYQNEIITNLKATYKKKYLYFDNKRISIYFKKGIQIPIENSNITIINARLSNYKSKIQLYIHKQSDFKVNYR
jgi:endonuclease/exonuclease/phosphatase family metal-dependent hydrolase